MTSLCMTKIRSGTFDADRFVSQQFYYLPRVRSLSGPRLLQQSSAELVCFPPVCMIALCAKPGETCLVRVCDLQAYMFVPCLILTYQACCDGMLVRRSVGRSQQRLAVSFYTCTSTLRMNENYAWRERRLLIHLKRKIGLFLVLIYPLVQP